MAPKSKKIEYNINYAAEHVKQVKFNFSYQYDADILAQLDAVPNKQGYVKELIRADIARRAKSDTDAQEVDYRAAIEAATTLSEHYFDSDPTRITLANDEPAQNLDSAE